MVKKIILSVLLSIGAFATVGGPDFYGVKGVDEGEHLNLREKPTTKSEPLAYIPYNATCLKNLGCKGGISLHDFQILSEKELAKKVKENPRWCKVEYNSITGWAFGKFLMEKSCP